MSVFLPPFRRKSLPNYLVFLTSTRVMWYFGFNLNCWNWSKSHFGKSFDTFVGNDSLDVWHKACFYQRTGNCNSLATFAHCKDLCVWHPEFLLIDIVRTIAAIWHLVTVKNKHECQHFDLFNVRYLPLFFWSKLIIDYAVEDAAFM